MLRVSFLHNTNGALGRLCEEDDYGHENFPECDQLETKGTTEVSIPRIHFQNDLCIKDSKRIRGTTVKLNSGPVEENRIHMKLWFTT